MKVTPSKDALVAMLIRQLESLFLIDESELLCASEHLDEALERCEKSFSRARNKYYSRDGETSFDILHGCQYTQFLYFLANSVYREEGCQSLCDKVYALQKTLSGADLFYQVALPEVFFFDHPLGTVMGRAEYSDYFTFSQGCTVGNNKGLYPRFGKSVFMMSNSKILGNCTIGDNVIISANAYVKDCDIPSGSLVFGQSPNLVIKENRDETVKSYAESVFRYDR